MDRLQIQKYEPMLHVLKHRRNGSTGVEVREAVKGELCLHHEGSPTRVKIS